MRDPGTWSERVTFQAPTRTADGAGGYTQVWNDITTAATVWAAVVPVSGRVALDAMQAGLNGVYRITIRRRDDLDIALRILWGGMILRLVELPQSVRGSAYLEIMADTVDGSA